MNFKYYDLMSSLVSGVLVAVSVNIIYDLDYNYEMIPLLAVAYVIGYFINALSSLLVSVYNKLIGGKPSDVLLTPITGQDYTGYFKVRFYEFQKVIDELKEELNDIEASSDKMFSRAMAYSNDDEKTRVPDFNAQYAFSRVILTTSLVQSVLWLPHYYDICWMWVLAFGVVYLSFRRFKERAYYYAREVLIVYLRKKREGNVKYSVL